MRGKWAYLLIGIFIATLVNGAILSAQRPPEGGDGAAKKSSRYTLQEIAGAAWLLDKRSGQAWRYDAADGGTGESGWVPVSFRVQNPDGSESRYFDFQAAVQAVEALTRGSRQPPTGFFIFEEEGAE